MEPAPSSTSATDPAVVYRGFLDAVNRQDLDVAEAFVDVELYRENCVGFTKGEVNWADAKASVLQVFKGIPDLTVEITELATGPDFAIAHGLARGTNTGRLYGAPATNHHYEASYFDFVRVTDGKIVYRVQQADVLGQMRQLFGRVMGTAALGALITRI